MHPAEMPGQSKKRPTSETGRVEQPRNARLPPETTAMNNGPRQQPEHAALDDGSHHRPEQAAAPAPFNSAEECRRVKERDISTLNCFMHLDSDSRTGGGLRPADDCFQHEFRPALQAALGLWTQEYLAEAEVCCGEGQLRIALRFQSPQTLIDATKATHKYFEDIGARVATNKKCSFLVRRTQQEEAGGPHVEVLKNQNKSFEMFS